MTHESQAAGEQKTVELQRSVRYGRLLIGGAILGAAIASFASLLFPIEEGALYSMSQVMGFMLLIGGAIGAGLGGLLALVLANVAKRKHGEAVVTVTRESDTPENPVDPEPSETPESGAENAQ